MRWVDDGIIPIDHRRNRIVPHQDVPRRKVIMHQTRRAGHWSRNRKLPERVHDRAAQTTARCSHFLFHGAAVTITPTCRLLHYREKVRVERRERDAMYAG